MRRYETIAILKPSLSEDEIKAVIDRVTGIIEGFKGSIIKLDRWGIKKLAYTIDKEQQGFYLYTQYAGIPEAVSEVERICRIDDRIMKYLTVKLQEVFSALPEDTATEPQVVQETAEAAEEATEVA
ncbi:MAG: 30S ribosomal protein S6 [Desulfobulbaceae bacterium]|nr:30S ribosomal protein S6 [Desulfobulbaceae bacterium]